MIGYWADLPSSAFRELDGAQAVAILPLGAIEQHGPHLPLATDCDLVDAVLQRALARLAAAPPAWSVLVLPTLAVTKSNEHGAFPGTLSLSAATLLQVLHEIAASVARAGVRRLLLFNGHGGNVAVLEVAARDARALGLITASASWFQMCGAEQLLDARERQHGIHAGLNETSAMLATRPGLVTPALARGQRSASEDWAERYRHLGLAGRAVRPGWLMHELNPSGVAGDAGAATAELGEHLLEHAAAALAEALAEFVAFDPGGAP
jgi:creatinine amidohydrolase